MQGDTDFDVLDPYTICFLCSLLRVVKGAFELRAGSPLCILQLISTHRYSGNVNRIVSVHITSRVFSSFSTLYRMISASSAVPLFTFSSPYPSTPASGVSLVPFGRDGYSVGILSSC